MPIDSKHPEFNTKHTVARDAYEGNVLDYIPRLTRQSNEEYESYRQRGVYFNVTQRTTEAMIGAILRKPFVTDVDPLIDGDINLHEFVSYALKDVIIDGRSGVLVDFDEFQGEPYLCSFNRSQIINWRDDGTLVVLKETVYEDDSKDPFKLVTKTQYRELSLDRTETGKDVYTVRLWRQENGQTTFKVVQEFIPNVRGKPFDFIPFVFINPFDTTPKSCDPVILNLAQINLSHFKSVVDLEHGLHFTALPTPVIMGDFAQDVAGEVAIGSTNPWHLESDAKVSYLEFSGSGLSLIKENIEHKEDQMSALGSKLLMSKKGVESSESLKIRSAAETATLINVVNSVESGIRQALTFINFWNARNNEAQFEMSRDFTASVLNPQEMTALMQLYLSGTISQETFLENLYEGEITPSVEEEISRLQTKDTDKVD